MHCWCPDVEHCDWWPMGGMLTFPLKVMATPGILGSSKDIIWDPLKIIIPV